MIQDLAKEIVVGLLVAGLTSCIHYVWRLAKDLHAMFDKQRALSIRVKHLEEIIYDVPNSGSHEPIRKSLVEKPLCNRDR